MVWRVPIWSERCVKICQASVDVGQLLLDVFDPWNIMAAFDDSLAHASDRFSGASVSDTM